MKFKLDENLGSMAEKILVTAGYDIATVRGQKLCGEQDHAIAAVCRAEGRILVTCDLDFGNPIAFPPASSPGIIILRMRNGCLAEDLLTALKTLVIALQTQDPTAKLWIVDGQKLRIRGG